MARFGIAPNRAFGTRLPVLRQLGKATGTHHALALDLWEAGYRETQILASIIADPQQVTGAVMDRWTATFSYWEICDQCVMNCFEKTPLAIQKAFEYAHGDETFVKRTGFVLMARLAAFHRPLSDETLKAFLSEILTASRDHRPMVKKAVSWALREMGKRNLVWRDRVLPVAEALAGGDVAAARWIGRDALRDLSSPAALRRATMKSK